jgi:hypothetical protein
MKVIIQERAFESYASSGVLRKIWLGMLTVVFSMRETDLDFLGFGISFMEMFWGDINA